MNILIIGATSDIASAIADKYCSKGANLILVARNLYKLSIIKNHLVTKYNLDDNQIKTFIHDANDLLNVNQLVEFINRSYKKLDLLLITYGYLPSSNDVFNTDDINITFQVNFTSQVNYINNFIPTFQAQKSGTIALIGSVAGDRGRQSNFIYGTSKGAIEIYLQGLRNKLFEYNINVLTIKPGFVDTKMTSDIPKIFLFVSPEKVAKDIINAIEKRKNVIYTPFFWKYIMFIIKSIPENIFKKLKI